MRSYTFIFGLAVASIFSTTVFAQEQPAQTTQNETTQTQPVVATTPSPAAAVTPARGSTMDTVRSKFGSPSQEVPAVGKPPITRWEYPGYVVYFENDRVLHTVVMK